MIELKDYSLDNGLENQDDEDLMIRFLEYGGGTYICDAISECADSNVSIKRFDSDLQTVEPLIFVHGSLNMEHDLEQDSQVQAAVSIFLSKWLDNIQDEYFSDREEIY